MKSYKSMDFLFICLMSWYSIRNLILLFFQDFDIEIIHALISVIVLFYIINCYNVSKILTKNKYVICIWLFYLCMFVYHTRIEPVVSISLVKSMPPTRNLTLLFLNYIAISSYAVANLKNLDRLLYGFMLFSTFSSILLLALVIIREGQSFLVIEALTAEGTGVTLITMSYNLVVSSVSAIYLIFKKDEKRNRLSSIVCLGICLLAILIMGKRGALLSVIVAGTCLYLFANKGIAKSFLYLGSFIIAYLVVSSMFDSLIGFLSLFNERLAYETSLAYYYGDTNGRDTLWEMAIDQIGKNPIWGYYPKLINTSPNSWFFGLHPHNIFLESLMTMGLAGSIPFFIYLIYMVFTKVYICVVSETPYRLFALLFIAEIVHGCFSGTLYTSWIWTCLLVLSAQRKLLHFDNKKSRIRIIS